LYETFTHILERLRRKVPREQGESIEQWEHRTLLLARRRFYGVEEVSDPEVLDRRAPKQVNRISYKGLGKNANRYQP